MITRCITRSLSVPAATIRGMASDQETVTAAAVTAGAELTPRTGARPAGPAAIAAELLARTRAELPVLAGLGEREELLAAWLASLRSARTRRAYAGDVRGWLGWLAERGVDVLGAGRVHVDVWVAGQQDHGAEASTVRHRLSALSSFYRYCAAHDLAGQVPTVGVARPVVDPDYTATIGLDRDQARALVAAADRDQGPRRCGRRRWSGCCCTMRCGWMRPAPSMLPTSGLMLATECCGCSARAPGRRESR